ncbi:MAG: FliH/SctL family protein [Candidatus Saganbacteria bacterium]|nr:FliH/SctL family protein [Candidatus Saganbacteria bacterium]
MGLIKRNRIQEKGTVLIEEKKVELSLYTEPETPSIEEESLEAEIVSPPILAEEYKRKLEEKAQQEARQMVELAKAEAKRIRDKAHGDGLEEGKIEGRAELAARIEEALDTINQAVKEREKIIRDAEAEILRLAIKIAEQIIRSEVSLHRDVCLNIVAEAIQKVSDREQMILRVSREDVEQLKRHKDRLAGLVDGVKSFSILEDSNIEPGGCMIETNLGFVDARISTKLAAIEEAFKGAQDDHAD